MPHPLSPITDETFVSVLITEEPIRWNSTHEAQVIMLISIEKTILVLFCFGIISHVSFKTNQKLAKSFKILPMIIL